MNYIRLTCTIASENPEIAREVLMQNLADAGFESFEEKENTLLGYIPEKDFTAAVEESIPNEIWGLGSVTFSRDLIPDRNWNEEWEKNFPPVIIAGKCYIRAPFHPKKEEIPYEILIEPKMAFGTGHHETTSLMIEQMLSLDFSGKEVLDMGCGTGVLAIMASMLHAKHILAIDIDEWAFQNTLENMKANKINNIAVLQGDIDLIRDKKFDTILANINRNILLHQIPSYSTALDENGYLLLSGIYMSDLEIISECTEKSGFHFLHLKEKNNWISALFAKK